MPETTEVRPLQPIRRFDVFAETKRLEALAHGEPEDVAKGYGVRIAKVVASKRFGGAAKKTHHEADKAPSRQALAGSRAAGQEDSKFRALDGELQTDETFDREIVERMGPRFYDVVFAPAIQEALNCGRKYEQIRDTIRKDWKPLRA